MSGLYALLPTNPFVIGVSETLLCFECEGFQGEGMDCLRSEEAVFLSDTYILSKGSWWWPSTLPLTAIPPSLHRIIPTVQPC